MSAAACFAAGFLLPVLIAWIVCFNAISVLGANVLVRTLLLDLIPVGLVFGAAAAAGYMRRRGEPESANPRAQSDAAGQSDGRDDGQE